MQRAIETQVGGGPTREVLELLRALHVLTIIDEDPSMLRHGLLSPVQVHNDLRLVSQQCACDAAAFRVAPSFVLLARVASSLSFCLFDSSS
jgi:hypothetical protein